MWRLSQLFIFTAGFTLITWGCTQTPLPIQIDKYCVSESGLSKYWLILDTSQKTGTIRYQYMGQDVRYVVRTMKIDGNAIDGRADFHTSVSGETRGTAIAFTYEDRNGTLKDGNVTASCENNQTAIHI